MGRTNALLAALIATTTVSGTVSAADFSQRPPVIEAGSVVPEEIGTGWYLRGDVGYSRQVKPTGTWYDPVFPGTAYGIDGIKAGDAATIGIGFGYKFNEWVRTDATFDYLTNYNVSGTVQSPATSVDRLKLTSSVFLWNGYFDVSNFNGFTPYVGAGIGAALVQANTTTRTATATNTVLYNFNSRSTLSLAGAVMAGVAMDLGHGIQADLGYRYLMISKGETGDTPGGFGHDAFKGLYSHQVRIGLRYYMN